MAVNKRSGARYVEPSSVYRSKQGWVTFECVAVASRLNHDGKPNGITLVQVTHGGASHYRTGARVDVGTAFLTPVS